VHTVIVDPDGTIAAPIVIELGLGYQDEHLSGDEIKVLGVRCSIPTWCISRESSHESSKPPSPP
jgi:hypothetical protein